MKHTRNTPKPANQAKRPASRRPMRATPSRSLCVARCCWGCFPYPLPATRVRWNQCAGEPGGGDVAPRGARPVSPRSSSLRLIGRPPGGASGSKVRIKCVFSAGYILLQPFPASARRREDRAGARWDSGALSQTAGWLPFWRLAGARDVLRAGSLERRLAASPVGLGTGLVLSRTETTCGRA